MKINWFSPLPPARTDIAHYTTRVLPALTELAEVTLWTDQSDWDQSLTKQVAVRSYRLGKIPWVELNRADANFYNIGNNPLFHSSIWQISRLHAGIVVLHDLRLHHFFDDIFRVNWRDLDSYLAVMESYYGEAGRLDASECFHGNARNIDHMAEHYPLTQLAVEHQLGVVVHTGEAFDILSRDQDCPLLLAPLPFNAKRNIEASLSKAGGPPYRLIAFGYIGKSRRLLSVLKALADMPERSEFQLDVYGDILDDEDQLRSQIRALDLKQQVHLHGFASEKKLDEALGQAHLSINLRYPTMGEASGSQLRIWSHGLPSLVSQVGWYSSLPAETVAFVRTDENEIGDIQLHLRALLKEPKRFEEMGRLGRRVLEAEHAPARYVQAILELAKQSQARRPQVTMNRLADRTGVMLSEWANSRTAVEAVENVAKEIFELGRVG